MWNKKNSLLLLVSAVLFGACLHRSPESLPTSGVKSLPSFEVLNEDGTVDESRFEESQSLSADDSLETIERELNDTVILEEDFSDL